MKKAFVTHLFGGYDTLSEPQIVSQGWDYICVTDAPTSSAVWRMLPPPAEYVEATQCPKRLSSLVKIFHYAFLDDEYEIVISADACIDIRCDLNLFTNEFLPPGADMSVAKHWGRECLYEEAKAVIDLNFDDPSKVFSQTQQYAAEGFPENRGMYACRLLVKNNHSQRLREFLRIWLDAYVAGSRRDQLSMTYALWKFEQKAAERMKLHGFDFEEVFRKRNLFAIRPHLLPREWPGASFR